MISFLKLQADETNFLFPTDANPLFFLQTKNIVEEMLKKVNEETKENRNVVINYTNYLKSCQNCLIGCFACLTVVGLPFVICYHNKKRKEMDKAMENCIKTWEKYAKEYNKKLLPYNYFVRFYTETKTLDINDAIQKIIMYFYEFTYRQTQNIVAENQPPAMINPNENFPLKHQLN